MKNIVTSALSELTGELTARGMPEGNYSIGANQSERTCIVFDGAQWIVYYSERGRMEGLKKLLNFADAKIEFLQKVN